MQTTELSTARQYGDEIVRNWEYALRSLRRNPTFAVAAILLLAIGIAQRRQSSAVVHGVLLRPL